MVKQRKNVSQAQRDPAHRRFITLVSLANKTGLRDDKNLSGKPLMFFVNSAAAYPLLAYARCVQVTRGV